MNVRESLNSKPAVSAAIVVVAVFICGWMIVHQLRPPAEPPAIGVFFTDDDGATWFTDSPTRIAPFDHNGKEAVGCRVFNSGGKDFAGYLQKTTPELSRKIKANISCSNAELAAGMLVKKPGDKQWVPMSDPRAKAIVNPTSPSNSGGEASEVSP
jgi:hypothetical protein